MHGSFGCQSAIIQPPLSPEGFSKTSHWNVIKVLDFHDPQRTNHETSDHVQDYGVSLQRTQL